MQKEIRVCLGMSESPGLRPRLVFIPGVSQLLLNASPINCEIARLSLLVHYWYTKYSFRFAEFVLLPEEENIYIYHQLMIYFIGYLSADTFLNTHYFRKPQASVQTPPPHHHRKGLVGSREGNAFWMLAWGPGLCCDEVPTGGSGNKGNNVERGLREPHWFNLKGSRLCCVAHPPYLLGVKMLRLYERMVVRQGTHFYKMSYLPN